MLLMNLPDECLLAIVSLLTAKELQLLTSACKRLKLLKSMAVNACARVRGLNLPPLAPSEPLCHALNVAYSVRPRPPLVRRILYNNSSKQDALQSGDWATELPDFVGEHDDGADHALDAALASTCHFPNCWTCIIDRAQRPFTGDEECDATLFFRDLPYAIADLDMFAAANEAAEDHVVSATASLCL